MTLKDEAPLIAPLDPAQVQRAAQEITRDLQRVATTEILKVVVATLALLLGALTAFNYGNWPLGLFAIIVIVGAALQVGKQSQRRRMGVTLPFVLRALGLEQTSDGMAFNRSLPTRLFPRVAEPLVLNVFSGTLEGRPVAIAEIEVRDRNGDSSDVIFEGLVLRVEFSNALPDFLILDETLSRKMKGSAAGGWFFSKPHIDIGFLQLYQTFPRGKDSLGLWLSPASDPSDRPLADVLKVLTYPPREAQINGRIHSATNDGTSIFVALRPSGKASQSQMTLASATPASLAIHASYAWLAQPLALAKALICSEKPTL